MKNCIGGRGVSGEPPPASVTVIHGPSGVAAFAQDRQFEPMEHDGLQYQQLASNTNGTDKPALLVFLHGGHARGKDNQAQLQLQAVKDIKDYILKNGISSIWRNDKRRQNRTASDYSGEGRRAEGCYNTVGFRVVQIAK